MKLQINTLRTDIRTRLLLLCLETIRIEEKSIDAICDNIMELLSKYLNFPCSATPTDDYFIKIGYEDDNGDISFLDLKLFTYNYNLN